MADFPYTKENLKALLNRIKNDVICNDIINLTFDERLYIIGKVLDIIARLDKQGVNKNEQKK